MPEGLVVAALEAARSRKPGASAEEAARGCGWAEAAGATPRRSARTSPRVTASPGRGAAGRPATSCRARRASRRRRTLPREAAEADELSEKFRVVEVTNTVFDETEPIGIPIRR